MALPAGQPRRSALIVGALALRYFYVTGEWRRNVELQARARVHALQARIRPHFLFNSMNTIAALTRSDPAQAEEAVQDLADLFRANLKRDSAAASRSRKNSRSRASTSASSSCASASACRWSGTSTICRMRALVPSLLMQPLLENAIYHGIEPRAGGGIVTVSGALDGDMIG